jgi:type III secretion system chaperone
MYVDVISLLQQSLREMGNESLMEPGLDAHSTIALDFDDAPSIFVDQIDGEVWLSAKFTVHDSHWRANAEAILACVCEQSDFIASRAPAIFRSDDTVDFYVLVSSRFLEDARGFLHALQGFQQRLQNLAEVLA